MKLRMPCEHDRYAEHEIGSDPIRGETCSGGAFLDALVSIPDLTEALEELNFGNTPNRATRLLMAVVAAARAYQQLLDTQTSVLFPDD